MRMTGLETNVRGVLPLGVCVITIEPESGSESCASLSIFSKRVSACLNVGRTKKITGEFVRAVGVQAWAQ